MGPNNNGIDVSPVIPTPDVYTPINTKAIAGVAVAGYAVTSSIT